MEHIAIPTFIDSLKTKNKGLVSNPFNRAGEHKQVVVLISFFLNTERKKKLDILIDSGILKSPDDKNIGSYYTTYFQSLSQIRAIRYDALTKSWERAENFHAYLTYLIGCALNAAKKDSVLSLLSKEQIGRTNSDLSNVVTEMLQDCATVSTLRRMWRGSACTVQDFILNS